MPLSSSQIHLPLPLRSSILPCFKLLPVLLLSELHFSLVVSLHDIFHSCPSKDPCIYFTLCSSRIWITFPPHGSISIPRPLLHLKSLLLFLHPPVYLTPLPPPPLFFHGPRSLVLFQQHSRFLIHPLPVTTDSMLIFPKTLHSPPFICPSSTAHYFFFRRSFKSFLHF